MLRQSDANVCSDGYKLIRKEITAYLQIKTITIRLYVCVKYIY